MLETFKISLSKPSIDRENFTMTGVIVASKMKPKDSRRIVINDAFMQEVARLTKGKELPVEANHNYYSAVGDKLGFIHSFTYTDTDILANIRFLKSADSSPTQPGMVSFIMDSIQEDPKSYMLSMKVDVEYFYGADGRTLTRGYDWEREEYTWKFADNKKIYLGDVYMKPRAVTGVDFVTDGALTNSTFSTENFVERFNALCTDPQIASLIKENFDALSISSLSRHKSGFTNNFFHQLKNFFMDHTTPSEAQNTEPLAQETPQAVTPAPAADQSAQITALQAQITALQAEITTLKATNTPAPAPAPAPAFVGENFTSTISDTPAEIKIPLYLQGDINKAARENWLKKQNAPK